MPSASYNKNNWLSAPSSATAVCNVRRCAKELWAKRICFMPVTDLILDLKLRRLDDDTIDVDLKIIYTSGPKNVIGMPRNNYWPPLIIPR